VTRKIPLNECTFDQEEIDAAIAVLNSRQLTMGERCLQFETQFAREVGSRNAVFVNSGSSANLLAFFALANQQAPNSLRRLTPGMEVIVPAVTWSTTIWPIVQAGGVPVLVDSDPQTLQMDLDKLKKAISPKTVGICPVHVLGNAVPMRELMQLAEKNGLWVIEDTCEALGTTHQGQMTGTFGCMGTYSFYFSHHITTVEGGMVVTDNDDLAELLRCLRAHGWTRQMKTRATIEARHPEIDPRFLFINTGFNLRPTEINAAFGLKQLGKLKGFNQRRREIADEWIQSFGAHLRPMKITPETDATWFGFPVLCSDINERNKMRTHLESHGIETRPIICGNLARQPAFKMIPHRISGELNGADEIMDRGLFWGSHPGMSTEDVQYVSQVVRNFFKC